MLVRDKIVAQMKSSWIPGAISFEGEIKIVVGKMENLVIFAVGRSEHWRLCVDVATGITLKYSFVMGKQYNKVEKRRRRKAYVARRKAKLMASKK